MMRACLLLCLSVLASVAYCQSAAKCELRVASTHPMRYYMSLPAGWKAGKAWPVVVAIESADRDFKKNADDFVKARGALPFILVVPEVVTNGGSRYREAPGYAYGNAEWQRVARDGEWRFDRDGLAAVVADVHRLYGGEARYYLTGWEAGGHTVFALVFNQPENVRAGAPVCPNYAARNISFPVAWPRNMPNIRVFVGSDDAMWGQGNPLFDQTKRAEADGKGHGYRFTYEVVPHEGHGPLASAVLAWFASLEKP